MKQRKRKYNWEKKFPALYLNNIIRGKKTPTELPSMEANSTNLTAPSTGGATVSIENLYPAIVQCFVIILFGYIAGRWDVITSAQGKGIGTFVSKFCLPALLFKNMCILNFGDVNWIFLLCILIAKSVVFFLVMALSLLIKRPRNYGIAGLFAIFATQSNDFALGFPLCKFWKILN